MEELRAGEEEVHAAIRDWGVLVQRVRGQMVHVMAAWSGGEVVGRVRWEDGREEHRKDLGTPLHAETHLDGNYLPLDCA